MINESLIQDIGKIIVFLLGILSLYLLTARAQRKLPNYLFATFLLVTAIDMSGIFLPAPELTALRGLKIATVLLQMPLFFLYVKAACFFNFRLEKAHLLHGALFLILLAIFLATDLSDLSLQLFMLAAKVQYYAYIIAIFLVLRSFKRVYRDHYSSHHEITYNWLFRTTLLFLIGNSFVTIRELINNDHPILIYLNLIISVFALFVICWFVLNGLHNSKLFIGIDKGLTPLKLEPIANEGSAELKALLNYLETERPYLDDKLTLQILAEGLSMPEKDLSRLINQNLGKHFFDLINSYRIKDAKALLMGSPDLTVLEILYEVGFNSKSSFYTAFKKETGMIPTSYRKSNT